MTPKVADVYGKGQKDLASSGKRRILIGAVGQVEGSVENIGMAMYNLCDELEPYFTASGFLRTAPFAVVSLIIRMGEEDTGVVVLGRINQRHGELAVAFATSLAKLAAMTQARLYREVKEMTLVSLCEVAKKYGLDASIWLWLLAEMRNEGKKSN